MNKIKPTLSSDCKKRQGNYHPIKDWRMDPAGYFLIRPVSEEQHIEVGLCKKNNIVELLITGKTTMEICHTLTKEGIILLPEHMAYLAKEIQKAKIAMEQSINYVQDEELKF